MLALGAVPHQDVEFPLAATEATEVPCSPPGSLLVIVTRPEMLSCVAEICSSEIAISSPAPVMPAAWAKAAPEVRIDPWAPLGTLGSKKVCNQVMSTLVFWYFALASRLFVRVVMFEGSVIPPVSTVIATGAGGAKGDRYSERLDSPSPPPQPARRRGWTGTASKPMSGENLWAETGAFGTPRSIVCSCNSTGEKRSGQARK